MCQKPWPNDFAALFSFPSQSVPWPDDSSPRFTCEGSLVPSKQDGRMAMLDAMGDDFAVRPKYVFKCVPHMFVELDALAIFAGNVFPGSLEFLSFIPYPFLVFILSFMHSP